MIIFVISLLKHKLCGYSFDVPYQYASNEYPQFKFSWSNKQNLLYLSQILTLSVMTFE